MVQSTGTPRLGNSPRSMQAPQLLGTRGLGFRTIRPSAGIPGKPSPATSAPGSDQDFPEQGPNRDFACRYPALTQTNDLGNAPSRLKRDLHVSRGESHRFSVTSPRPRYFPSIHQRGWTRRAADQAGDEPRTGVLLCRPSRPGPALAATTASGRSGRDAVCNTHHCSPASFSCATVTGCMQPLLAAAYTVHSTAGILEPQESSGQKRRRRRFMAHAPLPGTMPCSPIRHFARARGAQQAASDSQSRTVYYVQTSYVSLANRPRAAMMRCASHSRY